MAELKQKEDDGVCLQRQVSDGNSTISRLEKENASLKAELAQLRDSIKRNGLLSGGNGTVTGVTERQPLGNLSPNKVMGSGAATIRPDPKESSAHLRLQQNYAKLTAKYKAVLQARDQERAALKKRRDDCNQWANYCDSLEAKIKKLEKELGAVGRQKSPKIIGKTDATIQQLPSKPMLTDQVDSGIISGVQSPISSFGADVAQDTDHRSLALAGADIPVTPSGPRPDHETDIPGQDSANGGHPEDGDLPARTIQQAKSIDIIIKEESSSDGPVFVSERPVRKRKRDAVESENGTDYVRPKSEHSSSDPVLLGALQHFSPHESIDLDEAGDDNSTPKKRRSELETALRHAIDAQDEAFLNMRASKRHQMHLNAIRDMPTTNDFYLPEDHQSKGIYDQEDHVKKHRQLRLLDQGVKDLAEDEDSLGDVNVAPGILAKSGRLDALLNTPSPDTRPIINRPLRPRQSVLQSASLEFTTPQPRALPFSRNKEPRTLGTPQQATPQANGGSLTSAKRTVKKASTPLSNANGRDSLMHSNKKISLRQLPLAKLILTDFKVNPKFNDGHDFAFSEVVRNKAERQNLMGCVDPQCCGKTFRALAMLEREGIGSSVTTRSEDIKLLEDYLGANAYRLGSMSRDEKEELWLEAKMRELANKHGKHRERYTRRSSPPGFWNTDFPSTQEQQKEREEATKQEQRLVEERYKDAMRGNGRWLFKDE